MKRVLIGLAIALALTACSGDGGGDDPITQAVMSNSQPAQQLSKDTQTEMRAPTAAPTPQVQQVEVTRETVREVPVEMTRIVEVVATPAPDIQGFTAQPCDGSTVVMTPDPNESAQGVVVKGGLQDCRVQELRTQGVMP